MGLEVLTPEWEPCCGSLRTLESRDPQVDSEREEERLFSMDADKELPVSP